MFIKKAKLISYHSSHICSKLVHTLRSFPFTLMVTSIVSSGVLCETLRVFMFSFTAANNKNFL